jgi:hypothetical protein
MEPNHRCSRATPHLHIPSATHRPSSHCSSASASRTGDAKTTSSCRHKWDRWMTILWLNCLILPSWGSRGMFRLARRTRTEIHNQMRAYRICRRQIHVVEIFTILYILLLLFVSQSATDFQVGVMRFSLQWVYREDHFINIERAGAWS